MGNAGLALCNAALVASSLVCMTAGHRAMRHQRVALHRGLMASAFVLQVGFAVLFVLRFLRHGTTPFVGTDLARVGFVALLLVHQAAAVLSIPLVVTALVLGLTGSDGHRVMARVAYPIWFFSSLTGLLVYVLLYLVSG